MRSLITLLAVAAACLNAVVSIAALPPPPVPPENPVTEPKRVLGKVLFWDEQLSSDGTVACGTCHQFRQAGSDPRPATNPGFDHAFGSADDVSGSAGVVRRNAAGQPIADPVFGNAVQVTPRHSQSILGALWAGDVFWDGRARSQFVDPQTGLTAIPAGGGLESQSVVPILAANEMATDNRTWTDVVGRLTAAKPMALATYLPADVKAALGASPSYPQLFALAFGTPEITAERIAFALATYERTLIADQTPFDLGTLTSQQQQGLAVFNAPFSSCSVCHAAPLFTDNSFRNIGVRPLAEDIGRQIVTGDPLDAGRFKVPTLRNVGLKNFFMHNGRKTTLEQVMDFYQSQNGEVQFPENRDPLMALINIGKTQNINLIEFMRNGLTDPRVAAGTFPFDQPILKSQRGDANLDGKVDAADRAQFLACYTGPGPAAIAAGCERLDMDGDADIDCGDWTLFAAAWTAAALPPEAPAACAVAILAPATPIPVMERGALLALALLLAIGATLAIRRRG